MNRTIVIVLYIISLGILFGGSYIGISDSITPYEMTVGIPAIIGIITGFLSDNKRIQVICSVGLIIASSYFIVDDATKNQISGDLINVIGILSLISSFFIKKSTLPQGEYAKSVEIIEV